MFCNKCGTECPQGSTACPNCGESLGPLAAYQPAEQRKATVFITLGWIFCALSLFFVPIIFGILSVVMGIFVLKRGKKTHGTVMIICAVAATILGAVLGAIAAAHMVHK